MKNGGNNNQLNSQKSDQLIRSYQIPFHSDKEEVLDTLLNKIEEKEHAERKPERKISWFLAGGISVAATVAILVLFWFFTASETISTGKNETYAFRLPDASRVVLQSKSSVTLRKHIWNREVRLLGEGYFEVEKGTGFRVKTADGDVEVLGTRFLVDNRENKLNVKCFQGKVKTSFKNNAWILESGTQFTGQNQVTKKKNFESETGYPEFALFQKNFSNTPLAEVVAEMEIFFGVEIKTEVSTQKKFSGTIESGNLENVLRIVCVPLQLNYVFEDKYSIMIKNEKQ